MFRWLVVVALGLLAFLVVSEREEAPDFKHHKRSVVVITSHGYIKKRIIKGKPKIKVPWGGIGSGFFVSRDGYIVTASHVIHRPKGVRGFKLEVEVWGHPGKRVKPKIIYRNDTFDIAIIKIEGRFSYFDVVDTEPELGEKVYALGHPMGLKWSVFNTAVSNKVFTDYGTVGDYNGKQISHWVYQLENPIPAGVSGGVVFNSAGELVCMPNVDRSNGRNSTLFCVPNSDIKRVLNFIGVK